VSLRSYARHRGVSVEAVRKAIARGRLVKSITKDDPPQIRDVALADQEWAANTDLTRAHDDVKLKASLQQPPMPISIELLEQDRQEMERRARATAPPPGRETERGRVLRFDEPQPHGGSLKREQLEPDVSIAAASAAEKHWRSKKAELDYKKAAAELVDAKEITAAFTQLIVTSRTKLLGLPTKAKSRLPHLTLEDLAVLEEIVRESLEELAS
jgi:hypothetical protein